MSVVEHNEQVLYVITWNGGGHGYPVFEALVLGPPKQSMSDLFLGYRNDIFTTVLGRPFRQVGDEDGVGVGAVTNEECLKLRAAGYSCLFRDWLGMDGDKRGYGLMQFSRGRGKFIDWLCEHRGFSEPPLIEVQAVDFWTHEGWYDDDD